MKQEQHKQVGIWLRVSTEDQVKGESPEHHEARARMYAELKGWRVIEVYRLDAVSGKTVKEHPETKRMLADVRNGRISGLVFSKLARLARNTRELLDFADVFREHNADLVSLAESIDTSTPAGRLFYTMIAAMAQWERDEIAERVSASVPIRAKLGKPLGGAAPFGYQWQDGAMVVDPTEAPIRKLMYELFLEHRRFKAVARILNERGFRTRNGAEWSDTTVSRLLMDSTAKGVRLANYTKSTKNGGAWTKKPMDEWIRVPVEPVVSEELWEACNAYICGNRSKGVRPSKRVVHLFSGLVFCSCDHKMYVPQNSAKYVCYQCRNKIPTDDLEAIFQEQLRGFVFSAAEIDKHVAQGNERLQGHETLLSTLLKEQKRLSDESDRLYELYQSGSIDKAGFRVRNTKLVARLGQIEEELPQLEGRRDALKIALLSQAEVLEESRNLFDRWVTLSSADKRRIVETIVDRIVVGDGEVEISLLYNPGSGSTNSSPVQGGSSSLPPSGSASKRATQLQGFIAATSWKRAGNSAWCAAREIVMRPDSSGSRSTSSTARFHSVSSSRKSTPWCASETSPGRGGLPPPARATLEAVWCGARKGRWRQRAGSMPRPSTEATEATSSASASASSGRIPGKRLASMVLPLPGGPLISRLWAPAAATSSARRACNWPRTSARSGAVSRAAGAATVQAGSAARPHRCAATSSSERAASARPAPTSAASPALASGTTGVRPCSSARSTAGSAPRTGRNSPDSASSAMNS